MRNTKEVREKLAGARRMMAFTLRVYRQTKQIDSLKEATLFKGSIGALEWVLEKDRQGVKS